MTLLERCIERPASELSAYPSDVLRELKQQALQALAAAKDHNDLVDRALDLRYGDSAAQRRLAAGKDTGTVSFADDGVHVSVELPKKVEWDQAQLTRIVERIRAAGEDPNEFVEISYRVSEIKFNAWSPLLRAAFEPARTLRTGKPTFRLSLTEGTGDQS